MNFIFIFLLLIGFYPDFNFLFKFFENDIFKQRFEFSIQNYHQEKVFYRGNFFKFFLTFMGNTNQTYMTIIKFHFILFHSDKINFFRQTASAVNFAVVQISFVKCAEHRRNFHKIHQEHNSSQQKTQCQNATNYFCIVHNRWGGENLQK